MKAQSVPNDKASGSNSTTDSELGNWLKYNASWNYKKMKATTDIFSIPTALLCPSSLSLVVDINATTASEIPTAGFGSLAISQEGNEQDPVVLVVLNSRIEMNS